jgi:hypothetical protein
MPYRVWIDGMTVDRFGPVRHLSFAVYPYSVIQTLTGECVNMLTADRQFDDGCRPVLTEDDRTCSTTCEEAGSNGRAWNHDRKIERIRTNLHVTARRRRTHTVTWTVTWRGWVRWRAMPATESAPACTTARQTRATPRVRPISRVPLIRTWSVRVW